MGILPRGSSGYGANSICTTPACIEIANDILVGMATNHTKIDPCTNFDQLVCGNWAKRNPIPAGNMFADAIGATQLHVYDLARRILESPYPSGPDAGWITVNLTKDEIKADKQNFFKLQEAYQVCMNTTAQQEEGLSQLRQLAKTIVTTFPASGSGKKGTVYNHSKGIGQLMALFESLGIETTQRFLQFPEPSNPDKMALAILPPTDASLPSTPNDMPGFIQIASELIYSVHPAKLTRGQAQTLMQSVVALQLSIKPATAPKKADQKQIPNETYMSINDIQKLAPQLNFKYVVDQLAPAGYDDSKIMIWAPELYYKTSQMFSQMPPAVIQTYFLWKAIAAVSTYVDSPETAAYNTWKRKHQGKDPRSPAPRWRRCVSLLDRGVDWIAGDQFAAWSVGPTGLSWILARFFADKHFTPDTKNLTSQIIDNLEEAFIERIGTRAWATDKVKKIAVEKVRAMARKIGLPASPHVTDAKLLKKFYSDIEITHSLLLNALAFAKSRVAKNWASLDKPVDRKKFLFGALTTSAFHSPAQNAIIFLAGIQQSPIYHVGYPAYITFGGMGSIVGHEITHGFDNRGHQYDKTGKVSEWLDKKSMRGFEKSSDCFVKQYDKFTVTGPYGQKWRVDGKLTVNENIADAGGVVSSFAAWKKWEKDNGKAQDLPRLGHFTHEQLFFVKWGQSWCANMKPAEVIAQLTDTHSPRQARILLPMENSADFQRAFNCPRKKPVCELW
ncbi:endothelin-converting enzyme 1 [Fusarium tjaetaba]|uniref:Endothelin-converting enzyme 1 n=1 Tax=Fusarium tjaetaba TaxID=1567544 RepID=A0A8H5RZ92_9HYPO|nr:endothelin-converting enzyme 1 [Fusarium tjaetaba]KAF5641760.1 endothelin-converting enzyme 1 [Fusarium tjaetaba]